MTKFNFGDGKGPVPAHKHPNGGGWVADTAEVVDSAWVSGNARVYGDARVSGDAQVYGNAWVSGNARVYGNAWVSGNAQVSGNAWVSGDARVYGNAWVSGNAWEKSPLYIQGTRHALTNSAKDKITIGCHTKTFSEWLRHGPKIGKAEGYSEAEIKEYIGHIKHIAKFGV